MNKDRGNRKNKDMRKGNCKTKQNVKHEDELVKEQEAK